MRHFLYAISALVLLSTPAYACDTDATYIFACEADHGRKYIDLCAPSDVSGPDLYLQYRFGSLDASGEESTVELEFPAERKDSMKHFFGATYTQAGIYTQSVRFVRGDFSYAVYTKARGNRELGAGVEVRNVRTGKTTTVQCSERPRFYIFELQGALPCDPDTPVGRACIK